MHISSETMKAHLFQKNSLLKIFSNFSFNQPYFSNLSVMLTATILIRAVRYAPQQKPRNHHLKRLLKV